MTLATTLTGLTRTAAVGGLRRLSGAGAATEAPLPDGEPFGPPAGRFGLTHFNVVIPDLPELHRHLACMVFVGRPGAAVFDDDALTQYRPSDTATVAVGTAATGCEGFRVYSVSGDCDLREKGNGSLMQFADDLTISGEFPDYHIIVDRPELQLDITAHCTDQIIWFIRNFVYRHYGFPATYAGTITAAGKSQPISGILSLETARSVSLVKLRRSNKPLPAALKLPWHSFTWHVMAPRPDTLLMFGGSRAWGKDVLSISYRRQINGRSHRYVQPGQVTFEVLRHQQEPQIAHDGTEMFLPAEFRWCVRGEDGKVVAEITGWTDTDALYGLGRGWMSGYTYVGHLDGEPISGTAYYEYAHLDQFDNNGDQFLSRTRLKRLAESPAESSGEEA